ncbi:hypothetical protein OUZ56_004336 [Daphnia magna]|uniref:Uncharacterized protein n=1 Tax=Daphnia magna TaxID=35525 RepID=A0ABQ9YPG4_9CRUS|nr:hypothetical protein OUZ56_004336 [Daphnia magna]
MFFSLEKKRDGEQKKKRGISGSYVSKGTATTIVSMSLLAQVDCSIIQRESFFFFSLKKESLANKREREGVRCNEFKKHRCVLCVSFSSIPISCAFSPQLFPISRVARGTAR